MEIIVRGRERQLVRELMNTGCKEVIHSLEVGRYLQNIKGCCKELFWHSIKVSVLSLIIRQVSGDKSTEAESLVKAALLHDYGKTLISPEILNKSSALTTGERENMERHCELGYIKLKEAGCFNDCVLQGILDHHERLDGTGYSKGKKEEEISSYSKVIMIADVYDAMVSDRVYRKRIEKGIVCEYLFGNAGRNFCGEYIKSFINSTLFLDLDYIVMEVVGYIIEDSLNDVVSFS